MRIAYRLLIASALWGCTSNDSVEPSATTAPNSGGSNAGGFNSGGSSGAIAGAGNSATGTAGSSGQGGIANQAGATNAAGAIGINPDAGIVSGEAPELPAGTGWIPLPGTNIDAVCACNDGFPDLCANSGCGGIFAWSSGAYDSLRGRMIVFGGGHSDYFGNEIFALSLSDAAMARITDPGPPPPEDCGPSVLDGTQPTSRHTYDSLLYLEHADRLFFFGGSKPPCGYLSDDVWTYSFADQVWEPHQPTGPIPGAVPGIVSDYDSVTHKVFLHDDARLYSYDVDTDTFQQLAEGDPIDYHMTGVIDPVRRKLVVVGAGTVYAFDLNEASGYARTTLTTTGGDFIVESGYPGLAYDPSQGGRIVAWNGGDSAYALNLDTNTWTELSAPNGPGDPNETGTYKRWRHIAGTDAFVLINGVTEDAYLFRP